MMSLHSSLAERHLRALVIGAVAAVASACGDATGTEDPSVFSAEISGARSGRLAGSATASDTRDIAVQVDVPSVGPVSAISLSANNGANLISFSRPGDLPIGTHKLGPSPDFSGAYSVRRDDGHQITFADSGTLTITENGSRVVGSFKFYASHAAVFPPITSTTVFPVKATSYIDEKLTISGSFNAVRRELKK